MKTALRIVAPVEAITYLALLASVLLYRVFDGPDFTAGLGPVHGVAFLAYCALVLQLREDEGWGGWATVGLLAAAVVPLGGLWVERRVLR